MDKKTFSCILRSSRCLMLGGALLTSAQAASGAPATLYLHDGSRLSGQLISLSEGVYTLQSSSLGRVSVPQAQVINIRHGVEAEAEPFAAADVAALQKNIMNDPQMMRDISSLGNEPAVQAVLSDPQLMREIQAGNISALYSNPKFLQLLNNPRVQAVQQQLIRQ
jgi:hypothetical protein